MLLNEILKGTGVALVTPFEQGGGVDYKSLQNVIDFVLDGGVKYIVTLGTTGEAPTLSQDEKKEIISATLTFVNGRVPVVIGIGGNNTQSLCHDLNTYPLQGAVAVLSASPYYNKPSQEGVYQHYKALAEASPLPVLLYNVPGRTGSNISSATTIRLANEVPNIAGIKEASGNMQQCMEILRDRPANFLVVSGDDLLALPQIACGMDGVISVAANCFPSEFSNMVEAGLLNNFVEARQLNNKLLLGYDILFSENNPAGAKAFLGELGVIQNHLRLPLVPLSKATHDRARAFLQRLRA
ncbi:MAG: 4-hydroxy-tetrahydrodipicolinate synthase [Chitinophagaceae bacterium]